MKHSSRTAWISAALRVSALASLVSLALLAPLASAAAADDSREIKASRELRRDQRLHLEIPSGDIEIEGSKGNRVEVELSLDCEWRRSECEDLLEDVEIDWRESDRRLSFEVDGLTTWRRARVEVEATIRVPEWASVTVDMAAGKLVVEDLAGDLRVGIGAGEIQIWTKKSVVDSIAVDVGVGEATLKGDDTFLSGRRSLLIGSELNWSKGSGKALIDVELGAGEVTIWLD